MPTYQSHLIHQRPTSPCQLQAESTTPSLICRGVRGTQLKWQLKSELTSTPTRQRPQSHWVRALTVLWIMVFGRFNSSKHAGLSVPCIYYVQYFYHHYCSFYIGMLVTYIGPGHVEIIDVEVFIGQETSQLRVLLRKVRLYIATNNCDCLPTIHTSCECFIIKNVWFDLSHSLHIQSEDDCAGHETTRYAFFIDDCNVGNMTADMAGLRSLSKSGDVAKVTLIVPAHHVSSSPFNLTVVLSNTVEFTEIITSSLSGVNSTLRSNTWYTTSKPYYCESEFDPHGTVCSCVAPSVNIA